MHLLAAVLAITHVALVDPRAPAVLHDRAVVIRDDKITAITSRPPRGATLIDGRGKFLIPGLWDMHTHLAGVAADPAWSRDALLPLLSKHGIIGVRDMGGDLEALLAWRRETGLRMEISGPMLVARGKLTPDQIPITTPDEARAAVRDLKRRGSDFIKVIDMPSREAFFALADECRKQAISFAGHVPTGVTGIEAADAGMRTIEHGVYSRLKYSDELAAAFRRNGAIFVPTLYSISKLGLPDPAQPDPQLAILPATLRADWSAPSGTSDVTRERWRAAHASDVELTRGLHQAGVTILAGSDALDRNLFPGPSLHEELVQLVTAGLSPIEALRGATKTRIAPNATADLVLLDANPLADIRNTTQIRTVIRAGRVIK